MLFVELKNIAPPPVSNFETLTATPRPGKDNRAKYGIRFDPHPVDSGLEHEEKPGFNRLQIRHGSS